MHRLVNVMYVRPNRLADRPCVCAAWYRGGSALWGVDPPGGVVVAAQAPG